MHTRPALLALLLLLGLPVAPTAAQQVGVAAAVNQSALGTAPSTRPRTLVLGDHIIHNEKIDTNDKGLLQILLADGTSFTVGPNSSMSIDSFVYDPDAGTAKVAATLGKGVFRFIGGKTSKTPDGAVLNTPVGTVGIRGGISDLDFSGKKGTPFHIDLLYGVGITLTSDGTLVGNLYHAGYSIVLGPGGQVTVQKTPPAWTQNFQQNLVSHGNQNGGTNQQTQTKIASNFSNPPPPGNNPPNTPLGPILSAGFVQLPSPTFIPPDTGNPGDCGGPANVGDIPCTQVSTWAEINNSDLANTYATYNGTYVGLVTTTGFDENINQEINGNFALTYHFGAENGGGEFTFDAPEGYDEGSITVPVSPLSASSEGYAVFQGQSDPISTSYWNGGSEITTSAPLTVAGAFTNTGGTGHGVVGGFSYGAAFDDSLNPPTLNVDGAFTGTLAPPPP
ncbi:MAG: FecR family protein [Devosia sp.]